jgi:hypothetical protein
MQCAILIDTHDVRLLEIYLKELLKRFTALRTWTDTTNKARNMGGRQPLEPPRLLRHWIVQRSDHDVYDNSAYI